MNALVSKGKGSASRIRRAHMCSGECGWNLKRRINLNLGLLVPRDGVVGANDRLPEPILQPLPDGGAEGYIIPFDEMLSAYYTARSWGENGIPMQEKLEELGLENL